MFPKLVEKLRTIEETGQKMPSQKAVILDLVVCNGDLPLSDYEMLESLGSTRAITEFLKKTTKERGATFELASEVYVPEHERMSSRIREELKVGSAKIVEDITEKGTVRVGLINLRSGEIAALMPNYGEIVKVEGKGSLTRLSATEAERSIISAWNEGVVITVEDHN